MVEDELAKKVIRNVRSSRDSAWGYWVMLLLIGGIVALEVRRRLEEHACIDQH